jgi:glycosyltransferase involved in cell wall biosynthesis
MADGDCIRVLHVADRLWGGGAETSLVEFLRASRGGPSGEAGWAVGHEVLCVHRDEEASRIADDLSARVEFTDPGWLGIRAFLDLVRHIRRYRPHVVAAALYRPTVIAFVATWAFRLPLVVSITGAVHPSSSSHLPRWKHAVARALHRIRMRMLRSPRVTVHAVSAYVAATVAHVSRVELDEIVVVERGRPDGPHGPEARREARTLLDLSPASTVVITVGREHRVKNHITLVRAVAAARSSSSNDIALVVLGSPSNASAELTAEVSRLGLEQCVQRLGYRRDVSRLLPCADLFVLASTSEGFPGAVVEAQVAGLAIVASDIAPNVEIVGDSGILFDPLDQTGLSRAIVSLADDPARRADLARRARQAFESGRRIETTVRRMDAMFAAASGSSTRTSCG